MIRLSKPEETFVVREVDLVGVLDADPDVSYTLRPLTRAKMAELLEKHAAPIFNPTSRRMERAVKEAAMADAVLDYIVADWTGYVIDGQPAPCTSEYKRLIDPDRCKALVDVASTAQRDEATRAATFRAT